jgi:hypothetical protein
MAAVPCVQLRSDRLTFSTDNEFGDDHANVRCALSAGSNVLTLSGGGGARVVLRGLASPTSGSAALSAGYSTWKAPVRFVTTTPLTVTSPSAGLLQSTTNGPLQVDGSTVALGDRILVAGQTGGDQWQNGIYEVTVVGTVGVSAYVLERASDFDDGCHVAGSAVVVLEGTAGNSLYINTNDAEPNWTSTAIAFEEVGASRGGGGGGGGGGGTIEADSIGLEEMEHGPAGGELLYYGTTNPNPALSKAPARLALGTTGYPLTAGATVPQYAQLTSSGLASGAVTTAKIADGAVTAAKIGANAVTSAKLAPEAVTSAKLAAGAVDSTKIASGAITADKLANGSVTTAKLQTGCVGTTNLQDNCVTTAKLANGCVDTAQLASGAVTSAKLQDGSVTTDKITAGSVTGPKLATTVYKTGLILGTAADQEYVSFAVANEVGFYINNTARVRVTTSGGTYNGTWTSSSDRKWKTLHGSVTADALADLDKVDGYLWTWKDTGAFGAGVVAQEFEHVCASAVTYDAALDGLTVNYHAVVAFNLCCNKALKAECARLRGVADELQGNVQDLERHVAQLRSARVKTLAQVEVLRRRVAELEEAVEEAAGAHVPSSPGKPHGK